MRGRLFVLVHAQKIIDGDVEVSGDHHQLVQTGLVVAELPFRHFLFGDPKTFADFDLFFIAVLEQFVQTGYKFIHFSPILCYHVFLGACFAGIKSDTIVLSSLF